MQITPIFAGEEELLQEEKPSAKTDDSERLRKIQRIIAELAPDKYKAGTIPEHARPAVELPYEELEAPAEAEPPAAKTMAAKPVRKKAGAGAPEKEEGAGQVPLPKKFQPSAKQKTGAIAQAKKSAKQPPKMEMASAAKKAKKGIPKVEEAGEEPEEGLQVAGKQKTAQAEEEAEAPQVPKKQKKPVPAKPMQAAKKPQMQEEEDSEDGAEPPSAQEEPPADEGAPDEPSHAPRKRILPTRIIGRQAPAPKGRVLPAKPAPVRGAPEKTAPTRKISQKTYIPPARAQLLSKLAQKEEGTKKGQEELLPQPKKMLEKSVPKKLVSDERLQGEKTPEEIAEENRRMAASESFRKKLSASPVAPAAYHPPSQEQLKKTRDIAGEAKMPDESEEDIDERDIPKPPAEPGEKIPAHADYEMAKEEFKRKMEEEGLKEQAAKNSVAISEETLEQYAKDNLVWLYEIYKMGGMTRVDFMQKSREKFDEAKQEGQQQPQQSEPPENPALAALGREIGKKPKK